MRQRKRVRDNAKGVEKGTDLYNRPSEIRHREIRGDDNEDGAERLCEIIRLAVTIIDYNESHR